MKKVLFLSFLLAACSDIVCPKQYIANMYAKGTLDNYDDTGTQCANSDKDGCGGNKNCPGCHVKHFDRVKLTVDEVLSDYSSNGRYRDIDGCVVTIEDSLNLKNISEERYIPATDEYDCITVYEKEKSYLKAMGFSE